MFSFYCPGQELGSSYVVSGLETISQANPASPRNCLGYEYYQSVTTAPGYSQNIIASEAEEVKDALLGPLKGVLNSKRKLGIGQIELLYLNIEFLFTDIFFFCSYSCSIFLGNFCLHESLEFDSVLLLWLY